MTWVTLALVFLGQEAVTTTTMLVEVMRLGMNLWLVQALWLCAVIIDLSVGYWLGTRVQHRYAHYRIVQRAQQLAAAIERRIGHYGRNVTLVVLGLVMFPYVNAFLISWLDGPPLVFLSLVFVGDVLYYAVEWGVALGALQTFSSILSTFLAVLGFALIVSFLVKRFAARFLQDD